MAPQPICMVVDWSGCRRGCRGPTSTALGKPPPGSTAKQRRLMDVYVRICHVCAFPIFPNFLLTNVGPTSARQSAVMSALSPPQALNSITGTMPGAGPQNTSEFEWECRHNLPPVAMTDDHRITVRCLLETENDTFKVHMSRDVDVGDLKDAIKETQPNAFRGIDAADLTLFMVGLIQCPRQTNCSSHGDILTGPRSHTPYQKYSWPVLN